MNEYGVTEHDIGVVRDVAQLLLEEANTRSMGGSYKRRLRGFAGALQDVVSRLSTPPADAPSLVERGEDGSFDALLDAFCETFGTELCRLGGRQAQLAIAMQEFVADAENQRDAAIVVDQSRLSPSHPLRDSQPSTEGAPKCPKCGEPATHSPPQTDPAWVQMWCPNAHCWRMRTEDVNRG